MNDRLLLQKKIKFQKPFIGFLNFIHPGYEFVEDLDEYANPMPIGIIYTGQYSEDVVRRLNNITANWIIVNEHHYDLDLSTNEGLLKNLLPIQYAQIKNSKTDDIFVYYKLGYDVLLEKIKQCLVSNIKLSCDSIADQHVYSLFAAILGTPEVLSREFFNLVSRRNVSSITSSILTFLNKVQTNHIKGESVYYARLISQSNKRYGKRIQHAVYRFIKSKANKEVALYNLLNDLNRAR